MLAGVVEVGGGGCDAFRTPVGEVPTQQSHPVLHLALEQQGEVFEASLAFCKLHGSEHIVQS